MNHLLKPANRAVQLCTFLAVLGLSACLPDSDKISEQKLGEFMRTQAPSYASTLSSFAATSLNKLTAAIALGSATAGETVHSPDNTMAYAYCIETSGNTTNNIMVAWYNTTSASGRFSVKGIGDGAGPGILNVLSQTTPPETIGYFENGIVNLRAPRTNGLSAMNLPSGCDLPIPAGSPVVIAEKVGQSSGASFETADYQYRTRSCDNGTTGLITERSARDSEEGNEQWEIVNENCEAALSAESISISRDGSTSIMQAGYSGSWEETLNGLTNIQCAEVQKNTDEGGSEEDGETPRPLASTCDGNAENVALYQGPGAPVVESEGYSPAIDVACGAGATGVIAEGSHNMAFVAPNGNRYSGPLNLGSGWQGTVSFYRMITVYNVNDDGNRENTSRHYGRWEGNNNGTNNCQRNERMTISCNSLFSAYSDTSVYAPVNASGVVVGRANRITGWADPINLVLNQPYSPDQGWTVQSANCIWEERRSFSTCPSGQTLVEAGQMSRRITATSALNVTEGAWTSVSPMRCTRTRETREVCSGGDSWGGINAGGAGDGGASD